MAFVENPDAFLGDFGVKCRIGSGAYFKGILDQAPDDVIAGGMAISREYELVAKTSDVTNPKLACSPAVSFILRPVSHDITRAQAIETNDKIRKSAYSFELLNNELRLFPIPDGDDAGNKVFFKYFVKEDRQSTTRTMTENKVTDPSNVPYKFITYDEINAAGRQWIRKFTLALSKELLGIIRSKYASLPLPNGEVAMDGESLKSEGREEKSELLTELKEFLDSVSLTEKTRQEQEQAESAQQVLNKAPLQIYIG